MTASCLFNLWKLNTFKFFTTSQILHVTLFLINHFTLIPLNYALKRAYWNCNSVCQLHTRWNIPATTLLQRLLFPHTKPWPQRLLSQLVNSCFRPLPHLFYPTVTYIFLFNTRTFQISWQLCYFTSRGYLSSINTLLVSLFLLTRLNQQKTSSLS